MTFLKQLNTIDAQLQKIAKVHHHLRETGTMTSLEGDLLREYLRRLYEMYDDLEGFTQETPVYKGRTVAEPIKPEEPSRPAAAPEPKPEPKPEPDLPMFLSPEVEEAAPVTVQDSAPDTVETPEVERPVVLEAKEESVSPAPNVPEEATVSLFDKLQKPREAKEVNAKGASVKTLKELIPLNDKFVFIREFFDNSLSKYESTLKEIESLGDSKAIFNYLNQQVWTPELKEKKEELVERFTAIIHRKYGE